MGVPVHTHPATSKVLVTNDSKATVSVLYWYGNYPNLTEKVSDSLHNRVSGFGPLARPSGWPGPPPIKVAKSFQTFQMDSISTPSGPHWCDGPHLTPPDGPHLDPLGLMGPIWTPLD